MSNNLSEYPPMRGISDDAAQMSITAFVAGGYGHGVQFTIGGKFCCLAQNQVEDLIKVLQKRLECERGYSATDWENDRKEDSMIFPEVKKE